MFDFVYEGGSFGVSLSLDVDGLMSDVFIVVPFNLATRRQVLILKSPPCIDEPRL